MEKFGRIYDMRISVEGGENIAISNPFTLEIDITRNALPTANVGQFKIYNLPRHIRDQIRFDISSINHRQEVALKAGYKSIHKDLNDLPMIFRGSISWAYSERVGTNWITIIECYDGGFALSTSKISTEFIKGEKYRSAAEKVLDMLEGVKLGKISPQLAPEDRELKRDHALNGKVSDVLNENFGCNWFIDNGIVNVLADDEGLEGVFKTVDASTGLLGTPIRSNTLIDFDMIFEPRLLINQIINLRSTTDPAFNGTFKLVQIIHRGTISDAVCGELVTSCRVYKGISKLKAVEA